MRKFGILVVILFGAGCAAKLVTTAVKPGDPLRGVRVRAPASYIVTKNIVTEKCDPRTEESIIHLAVGEPYDIKTSLNRPRSTWSGASRPLRSNAKAASESVMSPVWDCTPQ